MSRRAFSLTVVAAAFALSLVACSPIDTDGAQRVTVEPSSAAPAPSASADVATPAPDGDCGGLAVTVSAGRDLRLRGDCPQVTVSGTEVEIDLRGAVVGELLIDGDRHDVEAGDVTDLRVSGQDNDIEASAVGSLDIAGDRNEIDVRGDVGPVMVNGNDNEVDAAALGAVTDSGDRNVIAVDR
ncbi:DUF3060 domain-containing protein [Microbacterium jiangjiandongii]|uniref:DUF3060 domain-containing protein n=1 Tax=Microbacterium jiangjiandongii TaxID=3049071 RepID=UPI00214B1C3D|nr:DUF3060 domain-containing protein [Microbacterium sp. zg.Y843]MCR2814410.1 DUF3060 domain-containing protein [Microbacterium sp. zg.Y843]